MLLRIEGEEQSPLLGVAVRGDAHPIYAAERQLDVSVAASLRGRVLRRDGEEFNVGVIKG